MEYSSLTQFAYECTCCILLACCGLRVYTVGTAVSPTLTMNTLDNWNLSNSQVVVVTRPLAQIH